MKRYFVPITISVIAFFTIISAAIVRVEAMAQKQEYIRYAGVGPAIAEGVDVDKLPQRALDFIAHHIRECEVSHVDRVFESGAYEVYMSDGIEIEFSERGDFEEIEAPEGYVLTQSLVREVVPSKSYKRMIELDCINNVSSIELDTNGYNVSFEGAEIESALFDITGKLVALYD